MADFSEREVTVFIFSIALGALFGMLFDTFKIIRKSFKEKGFITDLCDGLFWAIYACLFVWWMFRINDGQLRWFVFAGIILGAVIHFFLISRPFVYVGVFVFNVVKKVLFALLFILLFPARFIVKKARVVAVKAVVPFKIINKKSAALKRFVITKAHIKSFCVKKI